MVLKKTEVKMHRGVRRKDIFEEEMDYQVFQEILKSGLKKYECILHAGRHMVLNTLERLNYL